MTAWGLWEKEPARQRSGDPSRRTANYFMEEFTSTLMNQEGLPRYRLTGTHMVHYSDNDTLEITAPYAVFYRQLTPHWDVVAERSLTNSTGDKIYLQGQVVIRQFGTDPKTTKMKILTQDVRVEPAIKFAETNQPVTLLNSFGKTDAVGARVYLQEGRIELLSQVKGHYEPTSQP